MNWYDSQGKIIPPKYNRIIKNKDEEKWEKFNLIQKAPSQARSVLIWLYSPSWNTGTAFLDEVGLKKITKKEETTISNKAFFSILNLNFPGMEKVKEAVEVKDFKKANLEYLNFRRYKSKTKSSLIVNPAWLVLSKFFALSEWQVAQVSIPCA